MTRYGRKLAQLYEKDIIKNAIQFNKNKISTIDRFFLKVKKTETCWLWIPSLINNSFHFKNGKQSMGCHIFSFNYYFGKIKQGYTIGRTCNNYSCIKPDHLIQETYKERNKRVGYIPYNALKKTCLKCGGPISVLKNKTGSKGCQPCKDAYIKDANQKTRLKGLYLDRHIRFREKNKDKIQKKRREYYQKNREIVLKKMRERYWKKKNP